MPSQYSENLYLQNIWKRSPTVGPGDVLDRRFVLVVEPHRLALHARHVDEDARVRIQAREGHLACEHFVGMQKYKHKQM